MSSVLSLLLQLNINGKVPDDMFRSILPLLYPIQVGLVER